MKRLLKTNENIKLNQLETLQIDLKIFNKNNKICRNKIISLKNLANLPSASR